MDGLVGFLAARLDEDEQTARASGNRRWLVQDNIIELYPEREDDGFMSWPTRADARHAANWDPARVLREVEAKRRIIEIHKLEVTKDPARFNQLTGEQLPDVYEVNCAVCGWATDDPTSGCETLRLLTLPCADRPGYREGWKP